MRSLDGIEKIRDALPNIYSIDAVGSGVLVRVSAMPSVGDVNRGAEDIEPLRQLAAFTRNLRIQTENLGIDDPTFASEWLARFDPK